MECNIVKIFVLLFSLLAFSIAAEGYQESQSESSLPKQLQNPIIELAILYDTDFAARFGNDPKKIQKYWEVVIYDLHLRFQTLPSFQTSFRVTSLSAYKEPQKQSYFERLRNNLHDLDAVSELEEDFQTWAYKQLDKIPRFDVAILAIGTSHSAVKHLKDESMEGSMCRARDDEEERWRASTVISFEAFPSPAEILAKHIATMMGAVSDDNPEYWNFCDAHLNSNKLCCIMGRNRPYPAIFPKFFSECTDEILTVKLFQLVRDKKFCLDGRSLSQQPIIDSAKLFKTPEKLHSYTMVEQCQQFLNDTKTPVVTELSPTECMKATCIGKFSKRKLLSFTPLEGSRCGKQNKGRCFRGICVQHKVHLVNVKTGKCLVSEKSMFETNDKPILQDCSKVVTQMLIETDVKELEDGNEIFSLRVMHSGSNGQQRKSLRLGMKMREMEDGTPYAGLYLKFYSSKGSNFDQEDFARWIVVRLNNAGKGDDQEFLLKHQAFEYCLRAKEDGENVEIENGSKCLESDEAQRWKFVKVEQGSDSDYAGLDWGFDQDNILQEPQAFGFKWVPFNSKTEL